MDLGALSKMTLTGYKTNTFGVADRTGEVYTAAVNPETYTLNYEIQSNQEQASGTQANQQNFTRTTPQKMEFEFLFDSTGVLQGDGPALPFSVANNEGVWDQIEQFKRTVYNFIGDTHQPPFVLLEWGNLHFRCKLEKMQITFKLFKPDGTPVRAVVKASFIEETEDELREAEANTSSPDLTHVRTVRAGDILPLLCHDIYGDATLYREVARVNNLTQFRRLVAGQQLFFPPIEK